MGKIVIEAPTVARLVDIDNKTIEIIRQNLDYTDLKIDFEIRRLKKNAYFFSQQWGEENFQDRLSQLQKTRKKNLLFQDETGYWFYSGLAPRLAEQFHLKLEITYNMPEPASIPFLNLPKHKPREYQEDAFNELLLRSKAYGPVGVEISTGLGKTAVIEKLVKHFGLKTLIITPSISIANQIYDSLFYLFGGKYVGKFFSGKKQSNKQFVVSVGDSVTRVEKGTQEWEDLSACKLMCVDEAHLIAAETQAKIAFGVAQDVPYRFFFSATQMRNDGLDLLLEGITGKIVYHMDLKKGIEQGYLAKPTFKIHKLSSPSTYKTDDANKMTRKHLYYNPNVNQVAANLANKFVSVLKKPTLILIEEIEQFAHLLPYFNTSVKFAHGPLTEDNKKNIPCEYHDSKINTLVDEFNEGKIPILVGTSCISTGTDIRVAEAVIYIMGGKSEIKVKQALGRGTRGGFNGSVINPWTGQKKEDFILIDFDVSNADIPHRHSVARAKIYAESGYPIEIIKL